MEQTAAIIIIHNKIQIHYCTYVYVSITVSEGIKVYAVAQNIIVPSNIHHSMHDSCDTAIKPHKFIAVMYMLRNIHL